MAEKEYKHNVVSEILLKEDRKINVIIDIIFIKTFQFKRNTWINYSYSNKTFIVQLQRNENYMLVVFFVDLEFYGEKKIIIGPKLENLYLRA